MQTFLADIIPGLMRYSKKLDDITTLVNQNWVSISDVNENKRVYIFDNNGSIDIYENGHEVDSGSWKLRNDNLSLKLTSGGLLLKISFVDDKILALKVDNRDEYAFFVNETKYQNELDNISDILNYLNQYNSIVNNQINILSNSLPEPNMYMAQMLLSDNNTLINTAILWRQYCESYSEYYPLYVYQELHKRRMPIPENLNTAFNDYAKSKRFTSFDLMVKHYFNV